MMTWGECPRCKNYRQNPEKCRCELYRYWLDDEPGSVLSVYANDAEEVAEQAAREWFDENFEMTPVTVWVECDKIGVPEKWIAEPVETIEFSARRED